MMNRDNIRKLLELCGITNPPEYREPETGEELIQSGRYYIEQMEKINALGERQRERIRNLYSLILAQALQPRARLEYGNGGIPAIRQLLDSIWQGDVKLYWERQILLIDNVFKRIGLNPEQIEALIDLFADLPTQFRDFIADEAGRLKLIPVENIGDLAAVVAAMYREETHAEQN